MFVVSAVLGVAFALQVPPSGLVTRDSRTAQPYRIPAPTDTGAFAARAVTPPVIDGKDDDPVWRDAPPITAFTQWQPTEGKEAALPHRGESRVRRREPVRVRARVRPAPRQHHSPARAARHIHAVGHDLAVHRLVPRPAHGLRVRRERRRCEDRSGDLRRRQRGRRVGRRVGRRHDGSTRSAGRPSFAFRSRRCATARDRSAHVRLHDRSRHLSIRRARELAGVQPIEARHGVAARHARGTRRSRDAAPHSRRCRTS